MDGYREKLFCLLQNTKTRGSATKIDWWETQKEMCGSVASFQLSMCRIVAWVPCEDDDDVSQVTQGKGSWASKMFQLQLGSLPYMP